MAERTVPVGLAAAHLLLLSCVEDVAWEAAVAVVGVVEVARRLALHIWPPSAPVAPRRAAWGDPAWLIDDCAAWGLLEVHLGWVSGSSRTRAATTRITAVSLTATGRQLLDVITWRPCAEV